MSSKAKGILKTCIVCTGVDENLKYMADFNFKVTLLALF
jgi:hypothetical protein